MALIRKEIKTREEQGLGKILKDKSGERYGTFTVIRPVSRAKDGHLNWLIRCDCGFEKTVQSNNIIVQTKHCPSCDSYMDRWSVQLENKYVGKHYNMVTIKKFAFLKNGHRYYECKCDCGNTFYSMIHLVRDGQRISCGCFRRSREGYVPKIKGKYATSVKKKTVPLYRIYHDMHRRCEKPYRHDFKNYGGRGIKVCDEWSGEDGFDNFCDWAYENGYIENAPYGKCTLDRIDCNGNYEPDNCRWADELTQANNRRNNHIVHINGFSQTLTNACRSRSIDYRLVQTRLNRGWNEEEAFIPIKGITKKEAAKLALPN